MKKLCLLGCICLLFGCATSNPGQTAAYYLVNAITAYNQGNYNQADSDFNQAIRMNPYDANAYVIRGIIFFRNGDYDSAIADFETALRIEPNNADAREARELVITEKARRIR